MQWASTTLQMRVARLCGWPPKLGKPKSTYRSLSPDRTMCLVRLRGSPLRDAFDSSRSGCLAAGWSGLGWVGLDRWVALHLRIDLSHLIICCVIDETAGYGHKLQVIAAVVSHHVLRLSQ